MESPTIRQTTTPLAAVVVERKKSEMATGHVAADDAPTFSNDSGSCTHTIQSKTFMCYIVSIPPKLIA